MVNPTYIGTRADGICVFFLSVMAQMQRSNSMVPKIFYLKKKGVTNVRTIMIKVQVNFLLLFYFNRQHLVAEPSSNGEPMGRISSKDASQARIVQFIVHSQSPVAGILDCICSASERETKTEIQKTIFLEFVYSSSQNFTRTAIDSEDGGSSGECAQILGEPVEKNFDECNTTSTSHCKRDSRI